MGILNWLRDKKNKRLVPIHVEFTEEETRLIENSRQEWGKIFSQETPEGQVLYLHPDAIKAMDAVALVKHVLLIYRRVTTGDLAINERQGLLVLAIKTQAKALALHDFPFYYFLLAELDRLNGDVKSAKKLYQLFLKRSQEAEKPVDTTTRNFLQNTGLMPEQAAIVRDAQGMLLR